MRNYVTFIYRSRVARVLGAFLKHNMYTGINKHADSNALLPHCPLIKAVTHEMFTLSSVEVSFTIVESLCLPSCSSPFSLEWISTSDNLRPVNVVRSLNIGSDLKSSRHSRTWLVRLFSLAFSYLLTYC